MRSRDLELVTLLFKLVENPRELRSVVAGIEERLREADPELDRLLCQIDERRASLRRQAAPAAADERAPDRHAEEAAERARAAADLRRLLDLRTSAERVQAIRRGRRGMRSPLLVEALLREARDVRGASPGLALELADAALLVAGRLSLADHDLGARSRLVLRVNACRANLFRILGELQAAASLWRLVGSQGRRFSRTAPAEAAELWSLEASLRIDLREWEEAERLLAEAGGIYEATGDRVGAARVLLQRGVAAEYSGDSERALVLYQQAAERLDPSAEPVLYLFSQKNSANALVDLGRPAEARTLLAAHRELPERHGDPPTRLRWRWTGARVDRAEGRFTEAEAGFNEVANGLLALRRPYDAAQALLDTAELFLAQGAWGKVKGLAERLEAVFEARGVHLEARKALILFQRAARAERLTAEWLARLRRYLLVARNDRELGFDPAAPG